MNCILWSKGAIIWDDFTFIYLQKQFGLHSIWTRWLCGKESSCQCRGCRFHPWVRKIPLKEDIKPTPVFLPGKYRRQMSLMGFCPCGRKKSDTTQQLSTHAHIWTKVKISNVIKDVGLEVVSMLKILYQFPVCGNHSVLGQTSLQTSFNFKILLFLAQQTDSILQKSYSAE